MNAEEAALCLFYEESYREDYPECEAVVCRTPGEYDDNPIIKEYKQKGYELIDANMCGIRSQTIEILIFNPTHKA